MQASKRPILALLGATLLMLSHSAGILAHGDEPHGDHDAKHGGFVLMYEDIHFEVALMPAGVGVWFSDPIRNELPAVTVSDLVVEIAHADGTAEYPLMSISQGGDFWEGETAPIENPDTVVSVGFLYEGEPLMLDVPASALIKEEETAADTAMSDMNSHAGH